MTSSHGRTWRALHTAQYNFKVKEKETTSNTFPLKCTFITPGQSANWGITKREKRTIGKYTYRYIEIIHISTFLNIDLLSFAARGHGFNSRTGLNQFFQTLSLLLLKKCLLQQSSFTYSFINPQFPYTILLYS